MLFLTKITRTAMGTAKRVLLAQVRGVGTEGDDDHAEGYDDAEVFYPMGLISRPSLSTDAERNGLQGLAFSDGGDQVGILGFVNKLLALLSPALEEGETRLYGAKEQSVMVRLRADGSLELKAKDGQPIRIDCTGAGDVIVNGGSARVARVGDATAGHTHVMTFALTSPSGAVTGTITAASATDTINQGATHFKA